VRYRLLAVGKLKRGHFARASEHYTARLAPYARITVVELAPGRGAVDAVRDTEGRALLKAAQGRVVALDERGDRLTTEALARRVTALEVRGESQLSLLLGGAEGHAAWLRDAVDEAWSLSSLTLPHELARVVLLEQLYRIESWRAGHPYHRT
jgi:23S rRNA (pseudouridine1915-N3)-methyltransferase